MIKKIKIVDNTVRTALCDTTIGVEYLVTTIAKGTKCPDEIIAMEDTISFIDDKGDWVSIFVDDTTGYEAVEEGQSMTNNNQVNWDEIPEDVEAVVTFDNDQPSYYKIIDGTLKEQYHRGDMFYWSYYKDVNHLIKHFGDRFHLRPSPITQPTPEPPESTQVESSEVEDTTTPEFDWSSVEDDVEAVITYKGKCKQLLKTVEGVLKYQRVGELEYTTSYWYSTLDEREKCISHYRDGTATLLRRPPATTPPEDIGLNAAYGIYKKVATEVDKIGRDSKPSISTILQEAQQSILKHHGITGKVELTVTCKYR